ncbi:hypothetical protein SAICODRAFT_29738 [Saitoella complicata NRRL Y-17804]|uniref:Nucleoporin POM34 n=1 Tax=Saitoella complicata (strain BCRC 22490 / CBS 7301 / JCM 7358 / NBRC 10748 / NRRL Y-17804) TaxID=698492 RepID=A0A0E9NII5_SAICN|nr:uncharacterized protein SAICODRAFT_29738 [Saitoella complicata NRRL Y-17804]ODQ54192.1 hypothetical protein SAICODRAFT_29738 [Saitoella complicata NRRL Y-17804]GAO49225.1 hypothetical protein G7K_3381-t1 [Saitoella complicata NRRL Y-17804]
MSVYSTPQRPQQPFSQSPFASSLYKAASESTLSNATPASPRLSSFSTPQSKLMTPVASPASFHTPTSPPHQTPTGAWKHPALETLAADRSICVAGPERTKRIIWNALAMLVFRWISNAIAESESLAAYFPSSSSIPTYSTGAYYAIQCLFVYNIVQTVAMFLFPSEPSSTAALTPDQRKLLGLEGNVHFNSATGAQVVTPPRYQRQTPQSQRLRTLSTSQKASPSGSPQAKHSPSQPSPLRESYSSAATASVFGSSIGASRILHSSTSAYNSVRSPASVTRNLERLFKEEKTKA